MRMGEGSTLCIPPTNQPTLSHPSVYPWYISLLFINIVSERGGVCVRMREGGAAIPPTNQPTLSPLTAVYLARTVSVSEREG